MSIYHVEAIINDGGIQKIEFQHNIMNISSRGRQNKVIENKLHSTITSLILTVHFSGAIFLTVSRCY